MCFSMPGCVWVWGFAETEAGASHLQLRTGEWTLMVRLKAIKDDRTLCRILHEKMWYVREAFPVVSIPFQGKHKDLFRREGTPSTLFFTHRWIHSLRLTRRYFLLSFHQLRKQTALFLWSFALAACGDRKEIITIVNK